MDNKYTRVVKHHPRNYSCFIGSHGPKSTRRLVKRGSFVRRGERKAQCSPKTGISVRARVSNAPSPPIGGLAVIFFSPFRLPFALDLKRRTMGKIREIDIRSLFFLHRKSTKHNGKRRRYFFTPWPLFRA